VLHLEHSNGYHQHQLQFLANSCTVTVPTTDPLFLTSGVFKLTGDCCTNQSVTIREREEKPMENVNAKDRNGHTQLISASKQGLVESVKDLLHRGADITASSDKGKTALHYAAAYGHTEIVRMLIEKGAEMDARDREGHTPLMLAAIYGCNLTVQALLEGGADPRAKTKSGNTAVIYAENNSHPVAASLLKKAERAKAGNA
jgi:ankyrin repeat protein